MTYLRYREWIKLEKTIKLIPVVALLLAATINPFKGEFHDLMVEVPYPAESCRSFHNSGHGFLIKPGPHKILFTDRDTTRQDLSLKLSGVSEKHPVDTISSRNRPPWPNFCSSCTHQQSPVMKPVMEIHILLKRIKNEYL